MNVRPATCVLKTSLFIISLLGGINTLRAQSSEEKPAFLPGRVVFKVYEAAMPSLAPAHGALRLGGWQADSLRQLFPPAPQAAKRAENDPGLWRIIEAFFDEKRWPVEEAVRLLSAAPWVEYAEPRYTYTPFYLPNDPFADTTFGRAGLWHLSAIKALEAWDICKGDTGVVIGISDSGIAFNHPDLNNIALNHQDPPDGIDNDLDGYVDNYRGWDFAGRLGITGDNDPGYINDHGVSVTGLAAAATDNGIGVAGVGFNCRYLPLKAAPDIAPGLIVNGYETLLYAAQRGATVVNCSWGGQTRSRMGADVVRYVTQHLGVAIVAACGNTPLALRFYPAAFPEVLSVTNVHQGDSICCPQLNNPGGDPVSTTFDYSVDIAAPGWRLGSTGGPARYTAFSGTSAAAPLVAGAVALVKAHFPQYSGFQAAQRVRVSTDDIYQLPYNQPFDGKLGTGRLNVFRALSDPLKPSIRMQDYALQDPRRDGRYLSGDTLRLRADFLNHLDPSTQGLALRISIPDPAQRAFVAILRGSWRPGAIGAGQEFGNEEAPFILYIRPGAPENLLVDLRFSYTDTSLRYNDFEYRSFRVNPSIVNVRVNNFHSSVASAGQLGFADTPQNNVGLGVQYNGNERNALFEAALMIGHNGRVMDVVRNSAGGQDSDFRITQTIRLQASGVQADFEAAGAFDDSRAAQPIGLSVQQRVYAWAEAPHADYVIVDYIIQNTGGLPLQNLYAGIYADWDLINPNNDACGFDNGAKVTYTYDVEQFDRSYYGVSLLSDLPFRAYASTTTRFAFDDATKFTALSTLPMASTAAINNPSNVLQVTAGGPFNLAPGFSRRLAFALMAGPGPVQLVETRRVALARYRCYILEEGPVNAFVMPDTLTTVGKAVQFSDQNTGAVSWRWSFGDGDSSRLKNPVHSWRLPGYYPITLSVSDGDCEILRRKMIRVLPALTAVAPSSLPGFSLFPNPSEGSLNLRWDDAYIGELFATLIDASGRRLARWNWRKTNLSWQEHLKLEAYPAGLYRLELRAGAERRALPLMLQR